MSAGRPTTPKTPPYRVGFARGLSGARNSDPLPDLASQVIKWPLRPVGPSALRLPGSSGDRLSQSGQDLEVVGRHLAALMVGDELEVNFLTFAQLTDA